MKKTAILIGIIFVFCAINASAEDCPGCLSQESQIDIVNNLVNNNIDDSGSATNGGNNKVRRVLTNFHQQADPSLGYAVRAIYNLINDPPAWTKIPYWPQQKLYQDFNKLKDMMVADGDIPQAMNNVEYIPSNKDGVTLIHQMPHWSVPVLGAFWLETKTNAFEFEAVHRFISLCKLATNTRHIYLTAVKWVDMANALNAFAASAGAGKLWPGWSAGASIGSNASTTRSRGFSGWVLAGICFGDIPEYKIPDNSRLGIKKASPAAAAITKSKKNILGLVSYGKDGIGGINLDILIAKIQKAVAKGKQIQIIGYDIDSRKKAEKETLELASAIISALPYNKDDLINNYFYLNSTRLRDEKQKTKLRGKNIQGFIVIKTP